MHATLLRASTVSWLLCSRFQMAMRHAASLNAHKVHRQPSTHEFKELRTFPTRRSLSCPRHPPLQVLMSSKPGTPRYIECSHKLYFTCFLLCTLCSRAFAQRRKQNPSGVRPSPSMPPLIRCLLPLLPPLLNLGNDQVCFLCIFWLRCRPVGTP